MPYIYRPSLEDFEYRWNDSRSWETWSSLFNKYDAIATGASCGTTRLTLIAADWVYKLPITPRHNQWNQFEFKIGQEKPFPCAHCEIVEDVAGITVLRMERVVIPSSSWEEWTVMTQNNPWVNEVGDGAQVGYTLAGDLVAYDFAHLGVDRGWYKSWV